MLAWILPASFGNRVLLLVVLAVVAKLFVWDALAAKLRESRAQR